MERHIKIDLDLHNSLIKRIVTGLLLVAVIFIFLLSGLIPSLIFILLLNGLSINEYCKLIEKTGIAVQKASAITIGTVIIGLWALTLIYPFQSSIFLLLIPFIGFLFVSELFRKSATPFQNIALSLLPIIWISIPLCFFLGICFYPFPAKAFNAQLALSYFIILWAGDSGAFLIGKMIGKHPLFKRISPKKTWEGSIGGLLLAVIAGLIDFQLFGIFSLVQWMILVLIINITGTFGDFLKSMLKRSIGVKDSGNILPGHGGILDRFDTLIGSSPFVFTYLFLYG